MAKLDAAEPCMFPSCSKLRGDNGGRGLCRSHQNYLGVVIRRGDTTWEAMEEAGKILPRQSPSTRCRSGAFGAWVKAPAAPPTALRKKA